MLAYVNHARIRSLNQLVLSNQGKVSCSRNQWEPLIGLELMTDRHPLSESHAQPTAPCRPLRPCPSKVSELMIIMQGRSVEHEFSQTIELRNNTNIMTTKSIYMILH